MCDEISIGLRSCTIFKVLHLIQFLWMIEIDNCKKKNLILTIYSKKLSKKIKRNKN